MAGTSAAGAAAPAQATGEQTDTGAAAKPAAGKETPAAGAGDGTAAAAAKPADDGTAKPGENAGAGTKGKEGAADAADGAPDKYTLAVPDGAGDYLDADAVKQFEGFARAQGWTNDDAQAALEEHADLLAQQSAAFRTSTEKDPTYGGDNLVETQRLSGRVLDRFAPADDPLGAELRRDLARSGFGNKLSVVSFLARVGKAMAEDKPGAGAQGTKTPTPAKSLEERLYKDS